MDSNFDEIVHYTLLDDFENRKYKQKIVKEIIIAICAMLNSNGGKVIIYINTKISDLPVEASSFSKTSTMLIRSLEQNMISITGAHPTVLDINFKEDEDTIVIDVKKANSLITINYNLYLPSRTQVVAISPSEPLENMKNVIDRKAATEPVKLGSHEKLFLKNNYCGLGDNKIIQLKNLRADPSKRTTLPDRMTGKGNRFSCYVSAFANHSGGHIYYGITDDGIVEGEFIPNENDKQEIIKKVEKAINKMVWPEQIGQPKRGEQWEIFFEPVVDENSKPVPSTFVLVIYIAPCLGGVFTEEPECYEMVEEKVRKISFSTWIYRMKQPVWLHYTDLPSSIPRARWSSREVRNDFTVGDDELMRLINDGYWDAASKKGDIIQRKSKEMRLLVMSKRITAFSRRCEFKKANELLEKYETQIPQDNVLIFQVLGLYLRAALERASGDSEGLKKNLTDALTKAELIEPGLVTAIVYILAGTVADLLSSEDPTLSSPDVLSIKALEHLRHVPDSSEVLADMKQKIHITLATYYLGCNISGQVVKDKIDISDIDKAKTSMAIVHESAYEGNQLSAYREVQLNLVRSIFNFRLSRVTPEQRTRLLRCAFSYAKKAERLAKEHEFSEMLQWSKTNEALCTEELVRSKFPPKLN